MGETLAEKVWRGHVVRSQPGAADLLYIDLHLLHEINTPIAFDGLRAAGRAVRRPDLTLGTEDHLVPTGDLFRVIREPAMRRQAALLAENCAEYGIEIYRRGDPQRGIAHVIAPELGLVHPGMTVVCCDSHTTTMGAFGALAIGIGTSQVEHVLATQTLSLTRPKTMRVTVTGELGAGVSGKDLILALIAQIGTAGGQGYLIEYQGSAIEALSMEARMTICNMTVEAGSRTGLIAPDATTIDYLRGRPHAPTEQAWDDEAAYWLSLRSDEDAVFDREVVLDGDKISPFVTWGTNPAQAVPLDSTVPDPASFPEPARRAAAERALAYMDLAPGTFLRDVPIDAVFIGSCTNGRIEDLRAAAEVLRDRRVAPGVEFYLVPGSDAVRAQAVEEGLEEIFTAAGVQLRTSGCSLCAAVNEDRLRPGQRAASTNNRNFEGRQGKGARTHVVSPAVAAASAVTGRLTAPKDLDS
ncbi:3-isopropylmalate dehydratase large subunit [Amycolatopsis sp. K13G38]|uniref:3-isopropylmalate dehydratase large subunit n=1 Tax=Amycolatopsis acididurans TaxID=2724524 RepID=A0ABX1JHF0_9PSEU|nr:3-isopropylmalate dehydratase large subunit [Amycolatopsis acididurans]NKQ57667.1 3-isopropylmalate dehydratase large subunit [Amycolatopsis acididurans]